MNNGSGNKLN